jgi:hypothetical protein
MARSVKLARLIARPCRALFAARPMPHLQMPVGEMLEEQAS